MSHSFTAYFDDEIWKRGLALYQEGRVTHAQQQKTSYRAMVVEDKPYHVRITLSPLTMQCDCAFAKQGHHCRHMAAVMAAYEMDHTQNKAVKSDEDEWLKQITPYLSRSGRINNGKAFTETIQHYIDQSVDTKQAGLHCFETYLRLAAYLMKQSTFYYNFDDLIIETMRKAGELRSHLTASKRRDADHRCLLFCDTCHNPKLCRSLMDAYLEQDGDGKGMAVLLMAHRYENQSVYVNAIFDHLAADGEKEEELIALCEANGDEYRLREWAIQYYRRNEQYTQGIHFCERCCAYLKAAGEDDSDALLALFLFAVLDEDDALRDRYYLIVLHHPAIAKTELFVGMKEAMKDAWSTVGRSWMIKALQELSTQERLAILAQTSSCDLFIHEVLKQSDAHTFLPYWKCIYAYDRGLLYHFLQKVLCQELEDGNTLSAELIALWKKLWEQPMDQRSLLHVLISCKMIYRDQPNTLQVLAQLEELPYE